MKEIHFLYFTYLIIHPWACFLSLLVQSDVKCLVFFGVSGVKLEAWPLDNKISEVTAVLMNVFALPPQKTPGPGTYERTYKPMTTTITKMGRQHGLFFTPQFQAY